MVLAMKEDGSYHDFPHMFLYGVKGERDAFYRDEMKILHDEDMLEFRQYYSEESSPHAIKGYVTSWIDNSNTQNFQEYYICGSPAMVKDARAKLEEL
jgi:NAD(P)H-flavin reductase